MGFISAVACVLAQSFQLLCLTLCDSMDRHPPGSSIQRFSRQEHWSGLLRPSLSGFSDPWIELVSLTSPALAGKFSTTNARSMYFKAVHNYSFFSSLYLICTAAEK